MRQNGKLLAKCMTFLLILCIMMCQVAIAENSNKLSTSEALACTRLMLTAAITVIGCVVLCVSMYNNKKNQKK